MKCHLHRLLPGSRPGRLAGAKLKRKRGKIDAALALVAGLRLEALADRSELVAGESFAVRVDSHRARKLRGFQEATLSLPTEWNVTKEETETNGSFRLTLLPDRIRNAN